MSGQFSAERAGESRSRGAYAERRVEHQLAVAQAITHIGSWEWELASNEVIWSDELYRIYGLEPGSCEVTLDSFLARVHPEDRARVASSAAEALRGGGRFAWHERIIRPDGSVRELDTMGDVICDPEGRALALIGTCRDVTEERRRDRRQQGEYRLLEMIASGDSLADILHELVLLIEGQCQGMLGSILLLDEDGEHVRHGAAPNLPEAYQHAIDGSRIGPRAGSCGTAAFLKQAVFVEDIATDPLWEPYRDLALGHGLRACWSTPILSRDGRVLATFACYYRECRAATEQGVRLIARATHIAGIAIESRQLEHQLRALSARVESAREDERTGIAREIHDELGQALTALKMDLVMLRHRSEREGGLTPATTRESLDGMGKMIDEMVDQVRSISSRLRPGLLDDLGLLAALRWQGDEFQKRTGAACSIESNVRDTQFGRDLSTAVFRIFQEALTNVARHARGARRVSVKLMQRDSTLRLEVHDDGVGITPERLHSPSALGLLGMRERARALGGFAKISGAPGEGTTVLVTVPL